MADRGGVGAVGAPVRKELAQQRQRDRSGSAASGIFPRVRWRSRGEQAAGIAEVATAPPPLLHAFFFTKLPRDSQKAFIKDC